MKSLDYLREIRKAEGLPRAVLKKISVENGEAVFYLVTDSNYTNADVDYASDVSRRFAGGMPAVARVMKAIPSEEGVRRSVVEILRGRYPALAAFIDMNDVSVVIDGAGGRFFIGVGEYEHAKAMEDGVVDAIAEQLGKEFCGSWTGEFRTVEKARGEIEREELPPQEIVYAPRFFEICDYAPIDGAAPKRAMYIADLNKELTDITVCGTISFIDERETKKGKPYFSVTISDGTGSLRVFYFSKKATVEKIRSLAQGDSICLTGDNELFNGMLSFRTKAIDYGAPPADFVPEQRPSKPVPPRYRAVFPAPAADLVQTDIFGIAPLPESFTKRSFVVFDIETTGLNLAPANMDRIIEIGAVKIEGGSIVERFSSFVACPVRLSEEIVRLTGITDDMLVGAPDIADVIADFYKFAAGSALVGHNLIGFDGKFIRHYGEQEGYFFDQKQYDTLLIAQDLLRLGNYKLNTIADHFGFTFNHHRAYDDAFVTAKIFIELVRMKGALPQ